MWKNRMTMNSRKIPQLIFVLLYVLGAGACSGLNQSDKPAAQTWWLEPYSENIFSSSAETAETVSVSVTAVPGLDTQRILTLSENAELNKFAGARWADSLPELLTSLVSRSLDGSERFEVLTASAGTENCELELEVRAFYATLDLNERTTGVTVALSGRYLCKDSKTILIDLDSTVPVSGDRMTVIVEGFQRAVDAVMVDLLKKI